MITQPENLTKDRLKAELKKHGVTFSPTQQKTYYVELYRERIMGRKVRASPRKRSEFSSDEDIFAKTRAAQVTPLRKRYTKVVSSETYHTEVGRMSDSEMAKLLKQHGVDVGPITASTRGVYERKLAKLMSENVKSSKSKPVSIIASESDDEEFSSESGAEGEEELDVGGVDDYYQAPPKKRADRVTPIKPEVLQGSHSYKPTPRPGIQQSQKQQQQQQQRQQQRHQSRLEAHQQQPTKPGKHQQTGKKQHPKEPNAYTSKALGWLRQLMQSLLIILVSFLIAFVVFDYMANGESRLVNWVYRWSCPWIESLWHGTDSSE